MSHTIVLDDDQLHALRFGLRFTMSAERPSIVALLDVIDQQVRQNALGGTTMREHYPTPEAAETDLLAALHTRSGTSLIEWAADRLTPEQITAVLGDLRLLTWIVATRATRDDGPLVIDPRIVGLQTAVMRDDDDDEVQVAEVHVDSDDRMRVLTRTEVGFVEQAPRP